MTANTKKIQIGAKPTKSSQPSADAWVESRSAAAADSTDSKEPIKRLTIDIPESLHREIKAQCATRGTKIVDEVRELLLKKYRKQ